MAEIIHLEFDRFRPRAPAPTRDEEMARAADIAMLAEIAGWALMRRDVAQARPLGRETRLMVMEMIAVIRQHPRLTNG
jgi:hypothetical protein